MVLYRRQRLAGGSYFFTHVLQDRGTGLLIDHVDALRTAYASVRHAWPFETVAVVILPDHLHCVWTLPEGDDDYPGRWRLIKSRFSSALRRRGVDTGRRGPDQRALWQRRYWEHTVRDQCDLRAHVDYIHINPLKHGLVEQVANWPYSSFHRYLARGELPPDWGGHVSVKPGRYGE